MAKKIFGFNEAGYRRVREAVRRTLGAPRTGSQRRRQPPVVGGSCPPRNETWAVYLIGPPISGTFDLIVTVNGTTESIEIDYDATADEVETALEAHAEIGEGNVSVTGGQLPSINIQVEFIGDLAGKLVPVALADISGLSGSAGFGVEVIRIERGLPGDAS